MILQTQFIEKKKQVTEDHYNDMLGAVPPIRFASNAFLVGEAVDHIDSYIDTEKGQHKVCVARYDCYFMEDGKHYYAGLTTTRGFDMWIIPKVNNLFESPEQTIKRIKNEIN